jgi:PEP-CTERM motif
MRNRAFRPIVATLSLLILTGVPTQAAPVVISDVIQVLSNYRNSPELRLRNVSQNPSTAISTHIGPIKPAGDAPELSGGVWIRPMSDSLFSGIAIDQDPQKVDVIVQGDVEARICDCGDILIPEGGWPKWPLLFIGAIPFFFLDSDDNETPLPPIIPPTSTLPTPTPTATPPVTTVPEPASLLLFASGLAAFGAGLRRRYSRLKSVKQIQATEED